jgi:nitrate reductase NapAB chaperone NapD
VLFVKEDKIKALLMAIVLLFICTVSANGAEWKLVIVSQAGDLFFVDKERMKQTSQDKVHIY